MWCLCIFKCENAKTSAIFRINLNMSRAEQRSFNSWGRECIINIRIYPLHLEALICCSVVFNALNPFICPLSRSMRTWRPGSACQTLSSPSSVPAGCTPPRGSPLKVGPPHPYPYPHVVPKTSQTQSNSSGPYCCTEHLSSVQTLSGTYCTPNRTPQISLVGFFLGLQRAEAWGALYNAVWKALCDHLRLRVYK